MLCNWLLAEIFVFLFHFINFNWRCWHTASHRRWLVWRFKVLPRMPFNYLCDEILLTRDFDIPFPLHDIHPIELPDEAQIVQWHLDEATIQSFGWLIYIATYLCNLTNTEKPSSCRTRNWSVDVCRSLRLYRHLSWVVDLKLNSFVCMLWTMCISHSSCGTSVRPAVVCDIQLGGMGGLPRHSTTTIHGTDHQLWWCLRKGMSGISLQYWNQSVASGHTPALYTACQLFHACCRIGLYQRTDRFFTIASAACLEN